MFERLMRLTAEGDAEPMIEEVEVELVPEEPIDPAEIARKEAEEQGAQNDGGSTG